MSTAQLVAPASWRTLEFISDVHLQPEDPATAQAWVAHLAASQADALFILGDLFEVWVGDDVLADPSPFLADCIAALRGFSARGALFLMHGNRDFLMGPALMHACGAQLLADPTVLVMDRERVLLSHGDALCLDDAPYLEFRRQVRTPQWQQAFLSRPLAERQDLARELRKQSQAEQAQRQREGLGYAEVDAPTAVAWLHAHQAQWLIHGHTHRPQRHVLAPGLVRDVLSDWDLRAQPPRAQVLRLHRSGNGMRLERQALHP